MYKKLTCAILLLLAVMMIVQPASATPAAVKISATYSVVTGYGPTASFTRELAPGEKIVDSLDKGNSYKVRTVQIRDEAHLMQMMGAASEAELTDLQRGLLETYRFSSAQGIDDLKPRLPGNTASINLNLVDITGYTDTTIYKRVKDDFWPQNSRIYRFSDGEYKINSEIRISGTDCLGYGPDAAKAMKSTFAHEFGHSMDLTATQAGAYGPDNSHYINEKIETQASFAEGFANFIKMLFFPDEEPGFRESVKTIKIERPEGGYDEFPIADGKLVGEGYLDVEAINTLIFTRLAAELPQGQKLVLDSFQKHNQRENRMSRFLQNFIKDYPMHATTVADILNRETYGRLSDAEIRLILGNNPGVERFIATRSGATVPVVAPPAKNTPSTQVHRPGNIFKWKDANGNWQFTDSPPPPGTDYTILAKVAEPQRGRPADLNNPGSNPFDLDY